MRKPWRYPDEVVPGLLCARLFVRLRARWRVAALLFVGRRAGK